MHASEKLRRAVSMRGDKGRGICLVVADGGEGLITWNRLVKVRGLQESNDEIVAD